MHTELETRQVVRYPDVYAPGDGGDFPVKQAFLAFLQADAVADHIASSMDGKPFRRPFDLISMCVMEMYDTATFAQLPLDGDRRPGASRRRARLRRRRLQGGRVTHVTARQEAPGAVSPDALQRGEPFDAGMGWQLMDLGLKGMSGVLAHAGDAA